MWQPTIEQFKEFFNNEHILNIMVVMNKKNDKSVTPTEISDLLQIHISTAKKYLELLTKYNFAVKEVLKNKLGRPSVYTLTTKKLSIELSLNREEDFQNIDLEIWNPFIREASNIDEIASYELDENNLIKTIKVKSKTRAKRFVTMTLELDKNEQLFMKYLPFSTQEAKSLIKICNKANVTTTIEIKAIENFVRKLHKYNLIELQD